MTVEIAKDEELSTRGRVRSSLLLVALVVVLGAVTAACVAVLLVTSITMLNQALG